MNILHFILSLVSHFIQKATLSLSHRDFIVALSKLWRSSLPWSLRVKKNAQIKPKYSAKSHLTRVAGPQLFEAMEIFASF